MKKKKRDVPELKANSSDERIRLKVLEGLKGCEDATVIWLWIDKKHTYPHVKNSAKSKAYHYNYLMGRIIDLIPYETINRALNITLYLDLYFKAKRVRREELERYLKNKIKRKSLGINVTVEQIDSSTNNGLQVVDFVSYALFRCLEHGDCKYHDVLENSELTITKKQVY